MTDQQLEQLEDTEAKNIIKEISEMIDKSESAVKMKIKRAKEKFVIIHNEHFEALEI